jgi:hypothetical protein
MNLIKLVSSVYLKWKMDITLMMELESVLPNVLSVMMKNTAKNALKEPTTRMMNVSVNLDSLKLSVENA